MLAAAAPVYCREFFLPERTWSDWLLTSEEIAENDAGRARVGST
jgi:hypothetical protein